MRTFIAGAIITGLSLSRSAVEAWSSAMPFSFFFFNDTATTEIYTLSLHDALPISFGDFGPDLFNRQAFAAIQFIQSRSEEHTSELQSLRHLVCRLLLEKKKKK